MQTDVDYNDGNFVEGHDYDAPAESDLQYSDEMSRQAVGKLFAGGGKNDNAGGPLVKGYREGASEKPARPMARPVRQVPAALDDSHDAQMDKARELRVVERGRPRRESATTRMTQPESQNDAYKSGAREAARATTAQVRSRPVEPAARQNAEPVGAGGLNIEEPPRARPPRNVTPEPNAMRPGRQPAPAAQPGEGEIDLDGFRQRYNPDEMISPPRAKNKPVRGGQASQRDIRKDRVKINDRDLETINSFRLVIVGSCILVVALIGFLGFRWAIVAGQRDAAREEADNLRAAANENPGLREQIDNLTSDVSNARSDANRFRELLRMYGLYPGDDSDDILPLPPGLPGPPGQPQEIVGFRPWIPEFADDGVSPGYRVHIVEGGQSLAFIANIFWPHDHGDTVTRLALVNHLAESNRISNPNHIEVDQRIRVYRHPDIPQPAAWAP